MQHRYMIQERIVLMAGFPRIATGISKRNMPIVIKRDKIVLFLGVNKRLQYSHNIIASITYTNK